MTANDKLSERINFLLGVEKALDGVDVQEAFRFLYKTGIIQDGDIFRLIDGVYYRPVPFSLCERWVKVSVGDLVGIIVNEPNILVRETLLAVIKPS